MTTDCRHLLSIYVHAHKTGNSVPPHIDAEARAALAQPEPEVVGPTDEELLATLNKATADFPPRHPEAEALNAVEYPLALELRKARAVLARWGCPTPQPIPVSERLPEAGDCDAEGQIWAWYCDDPDVEYEGNFWTPLYLRLVTASHNVTHWLPHWALPIPSPPSFSTMASYRVEAHDGKNWSFGIRMHPYTRIPVFCDLALADCFPTEAEATDFLATAQRLCGGTLRVAPARDSEHK